MWEGSRPCRVPGCDRSHKVVQLVGVAAFGCTGGGEDDQFGRQLAGEEFEALRRSGCCHRGSFRVARISENPQPSCAGSRRQAGRPRSSVASAALMCEPNSVSDVISEADEAQRSLAPISAPIAGVRKMTPLCLPLVQLQSKSSGLTSFGRLLSGQRIRTRPSRSASFWAMYGSIRAASHSPSTQIHCRLRGQRLHGVRLEPQHGHARRRQRLDAAGASAQVKRQDQPSNRTEGPVTVTPSVGPFQSRRFYSLWLFNRWHCR